jgi:hypothetical protein
MHFLGLHRLAPGLSSLTIAMASLAASGCSSTHGDGDRVATSDANLTAAETGAIEAANTLSLERLTGDVGLSRMVASSIIGTREGADGAVGTADDVRFETMADLREVPLFNETAEAQLLAYGAMMEESTHAPWRKGLPKGPVSLVFSAVTLVQNTGVTAYLSEMAARITCMLSGNNPGEVRITCEVPRNVWGCNYVTGVVSCSVYNLEGGDHGSFSEAIGMVDADGSFVAEAPPSSSSPGAVHVGGSVLLDGDKIAGVEVTSFSMSQTCNTKICRGHTIHDLSPYDATVVLRAPDENRLVTNMDYLACHQAGECIDNLRPDPQEFGYSRHYFPSQSLIDVLSKRPMDPLRANRYAADFFCRAVTRSWAAAVGLRAQARMTGDFGEFSCEVK